MTAVVTMSEMFTCPIYAELREDSNTALDLAEFFETILALELVSAGDFLILDNAKVHERNDDTEESFQLLENAGVNIRRLPTYSPELNPIELVFGFIKNKLRSHSVATDSHEYEAPFRHRLNAVLNMITIPMISSFYNKCLRVEACDM